MSFVELDICVLGDSFVLFETFPPYSAHVPFFNISYYSFTIIFVFASPLLLPCAKYPVWNTHLVHGIPVPYSSC